jgi:hypothetical protein
MPDALWVEGATTTIDLDDVSLWNSRVASPVDALAGAPLWGQGSPRGGGAPDPATALDVAPMSACDVDGHAVETNGASSWNPRTPPHLRVMRVANAADHEAVVDVDGALWQPATNGHGSDLNGAPLWDPRVNGHVAPPISHL